ncbi:nuclear transport factor 2 family protein [Rheinheimera sp.]|uniref:nuclear transport factor 2 family protein n=1 Tax=Rheinheimera sp. TaxID=1869214 RepID=UPI0027323A20|nr:nuclear transport factor 2 family protein [Rheinheimera sp.]MDP2713688.1 nuclear transport factor 2 family protein [Rheinheimera sp.]
MTLKTSVTRYCAVLSSSLLLTTAVFAAQLSAKPAIQPHQSLHDELALKDAEFFQRGFNQCDLAYLDATISPQLKFYHDQGGFQDKALFMQNTQKYICGDMAHKPIRKLTVGSLSTFPLYRDGILYGAVQHGRHQFYLREEGKPDQLTGTARFTSVWLKQGDAWQLSDVLSYDHQPAEAG